MLQLAVRYRWLGFAIAVALAAAAYPASRTVQMDRSLTALLTPDDPDAVALRRVAQTLGDDPIVMLVYRDDELPTPAGIARNEFLTTAVSDIEGVRGVLSPAVLESIVARMRPLGRRPALFNRRDKVARGFDEMFAGYTHSATHRDAAVVAILQSDPAATDAAIETIKTSIDDWQKQLADLSGQTPAVYPISLVGQPVLVDDAFDLIDRDGRAMAAVILCLLTIVIVVCLLDFRPAATAVLVIAFAVITTRAILSIAGVPLSLVSSILSAILCIVAVTSTLHLGVAVDRLRRGGTIDRVDALAAGLAAVWSPIVWTCGTTAAGFVALSVSEILPVRQFGCTVAIGAALVPPALLLIAPTLFTLTLTPPPPVERALLPVAAHPPNPSNSPVAPTNPLHRHTTHLAQRIAAAAIQHRQPLFGLAAAATIITGVGLGRTEIESNFLRNFRDDSAIASDYETVERRLGGAGVWDVLVPIPDQLDRDTMRSLRGLQDDLRAIEIGGRPALTKVLSLADAERVAADAPLMRFVSPETRLNVMETAIPVFYQTLITEPPKDATDNTGARNNRWFRIMLRSNEDASTARRQQTIAAVRRVIADSTSNNNTAANPVQRPNAAARKPYADAREPYVAGYYVVLTRLVQSLLADQYRCLALSVALITIMLAIALRNLRRVLAAIAVNLLPIIWILGTTGLTTGRLNMGAAMIAAVSIGLSIDGSVHYLLALPRQTPTRQQAITTAAQIGLPILLATIALIAGFGTLTQSQFIPTATFGALLAQTLAVATLANLTLLPAAIIGTHRTK